MNGLRRDEYASEELKVRVEVLSRFSASDRADMWPCRGKSLRKVQGAAYAGEELRTTLRFPTAWRTRFTQFSKISLAAELPSSKSTRSTTCLCLWQPACRQVLVVAGKAHKAVKFHFDFSFVIIRLRARPNLTKVVFDLNWRDYFTD